MSHKPTRKHSTSNLPDAKQGDIAFHTDTLKPMFWNNGWHQFDNEYRGPVDLFIIAGQSNAHGHALVSGLNDDQIITNDVMFHTSWHHATSDATTTQYYSDWVYDVTAGATRGDDNESTLDSTQFGPELGFARRAKNLTSTRAKIGIVKHAIGASQLTAGDVGWSDWDMGDYADDVREGDALRAWKRTIDDAAAKLTALNITYRWKGMIWWQGESGTDTTNVQLLWQHMRDYLNAPDMAIVATRLGYGVANTWTDASVFTNTSNVAVVDATEFGHSGVVNHVGDDGEDPRDMFNIGMDYANKFAELFNEPPIAKIDQTILFPGQPSKDQAAGTHTINNVSTSSGLPVTFTSSDTSVATIAGNVVTMLTPGTITITATQPGDNTHNPATATQTFQITDGLWSPEYDAGAQGWWDASDTSTLTVDSDNTSVLSWADKTSNGLDFTVNSTSKPQLDSETVGDNTLTTIHMSDDEFFTNFLTDAQKAALGIKNDASSLKDMLWFFVARADPSVAQTGSGNENLFQITGTVSDDTTEAKTRELMILNTNDSTTNDMRWYDRYDHGGAEASVNITKAYAFKNATYPAVTSPDWFMFATQFDRVNSIVRTWTNGNAISTTTSAPWPMADVNTRFRLNKYSKHLEGEWGEIVMTDSVGDREKIEGYLAHKWGIALPSGHTYETEAP